MHEPRLECPRCARRMELGFLLEIGDSDARSVTKWVEGVPKKKFLIGLHIKDRRVLPLTTYRCEKCGYLESYALAPIG